MDHALSQARQRAAAAISAQQQQAIEEANKVVAEFAEGLKDLAALYATGAGLEGEWGFANNEAGEVVLRKVKKEEGNADVAESAEGTRHTVGGQAEGAL